MEANEMMILTSAAGDEDFIQHFDKNYDQERKYDEKRDGIYFKTYKGSPEGHFVCVKNRVKWDSYKWGQQKENSNGFCQTFAIMNFLANQATIPKVGIYEHTVTALKFLKSHAAKLVKPISRQLIDQSELSVGLSAPISKKDVETFIQDFLNKSERDLLFLVQTEAKYPSIETVVKAIAADKTKKVHKVKKTPKYNALARQIQDAKYKKLYHPRRQKRPIQPVQPPAPRVLPGFVAAQTIDGGWVDAGRSFEDNIPVVEMTAESARRASLFEQRNARAKAAREQESLKTHNSNQIILGNKL